MATSPTVPVQAAGRLLDDSGNGINGATVQAYSTGTNVLTGTTTTANHPTWGDAGYWAFSGLPNDIYRYKITYQGKVRELYGGVRPQYSALTVGNYGAFSVGVTGDTVLRSGFPLVDGSFSESPYLKFTGIYDANPAGGSITETERTMSLRLVVDASGAYHIGIYNNAGTKVATIGSDGTYTKL